MVRQPPTERTRRRLKFVGVGFFITGINIVVLWVLVSGLGMFPILANLTRVGFTTQLHFYLHRRFTWKGAHTTSLWQQWYRFQLLKSGSTVLNQAAFAVLIMMGMPYMVAYLVSVAGLGVINLSVTGKLVFPSQAKPIEAKSPSKEPDAPVV